MAASLRACDVENRNSKVSKTGESTSLGNEKSSVTHSRDLLKVDGGKGLDLLIKKKDTKPKQTFMMQRSPLLSQVQAFLPKMAAADNELKERLNTVQPGDLDIENVDQCEGPVIEMNLALVEQDSCCSEDSDSEDSSIDSDVEDQPIIDIVTEHNIKISQSGHRKQKPHIEVISEKTLADIENN